MSTSAQLKGQEKPEPISLTGEDWYTFSPEKRIQLTSGLNNDKWGWVMYRCSYAKEFDGAWNDLKRRIQRDMRKSILKSDAPSIAENMDFIFVEDVALEDASIDELQRRFQAWVRKNNTSGVDLDNPQGSRSSRNNYFLRVDGEGLWNGGYLGYVGLVQGWPLPPESEDGIEEPEREDWMKIYMRDIGPHVYDMLENDEMFYTYYVPPTSGPVSYW
jgi:phosphatidylserine/phosphatidylglycerophosphate/cardiolipin synthase-like enzyme